MNKYAQRVPADPDLGADRAMSPDRFQDLADIFAALGDPTRLRIVSALARGELCVCELSQSLGISPSNCSHQLRLLRGLRLVRSRREGKHVYYAADDEHVRHLVQQGLAHVAEAR